MVSHCPEALKALAGAAESHSEAEQRSSAAASADLAGRRCWPGALAAWRTTVVAASFEAVHGASAAEDDASY